MKIIWSLALVCAIFVAMLVGCASSPMDRKLEWHQCYQGFEQEFLRYAANTSDCGYFSLSNAAQRTRASACVGKSLRAHRRFRVAINYSGTDEWLCEVIVSDQSDRVIKLHFSGDLYAKSGEFESFKCGGIDLGSEDSADIKATGCVALERIAPVY